MIYLIIGLGSFLGGIARYWLSGVVHLWTGVMFPWGTLTVNVIGSFIIGFLYSLFSPTGLFLVSSETRYFLTIGICGGFTTFSTFSLETLNLFQEGEFFKVGLNIIVTVLLCLLFVWLGHLLASLMAQLKESS